MVSKKGKKPELQVIAGCLKGLTGYLYNFTQSASEGTSAMYALACTCTNVHVYIYTYMYVCLLAGFFCVSNNLIIWRIKFLLLLTLILFSNFFLLVMRI